MWVSSSKAEKLEADIKAKTAKVDELTSQNTEIQAAIGAAERLLAVTEKKLESANAANKELEEQVNAERRSKEQAMALLEGEGGGGGGGGGPSREVMAALEEERKNQQATIAKMEAQLKDAAEKGAQDLLALSKRMDNKEKALLEAQTKINKVRSPAASAGAGRRSGRVHQRPTPKTARAERAGGTGKRTNDRRRRPTPTTSLLRTCCARAARQRPTPTTSFSCARFARNH
jgi:DNA repair exonuclease SbcCD ATPase subunit